MDIKVFITGGTFDKTYDEINGRLYFQDSNLPEMLKLGRSRLQIAIRTLMMIDSTEMTNQERQTIIENIKQCTENKVIITHGTDTMVTTAQMIAKEVSDKTIVITGAIIPYKFGSSDGLFNLGSASAFVQTLPEGVYIAMNGRYFNHDNCQKNKKTGEFEELN